MTEAKMRKTLAAKFEENPQLMLNPKMWSIDFLREWKDHLPPSWYWEENYPENKEQEKIWKEFRPKE